VRSLNDDPSLLPFSTKRVTTAGGRVVAKLEYGSNVRSSEWIAFLYFLYLAGVCWLRPLPASRRLLVTGASLTLAAAIGAVALYAPAGVRDWAPLLYVTVGYYLTGRLFVKPSPALESWLRAWDRRLLGDPTSRFAHWPAWIVAYLDIVYMFCFLLLPGGFAALTATGHSRLANHYWTMVLAADLGAFAPLSVFQTRPPWMIEGAAALPDGSVHRLASYMVRNATIRVNTFPSGHVAVSLAAALAVSSSMPLTGGILLALAASVSAACIVGRYHYVVDVLAGAVLAGGVWAATTISGI
jgi:membrane-associated phospholipid phosphatase